MIEPMDTRRKLNVDKPLKTRAGCFMNVLCPLREKYPNTKFFLVRVFSYSDRIRENTDHKKLYIWTLFTQWYVQ